MHAHPQAPRRTPGRAADPGLRVGDAERNQVVDQLAEHHAAGRLTQAEFEDRMASALTARTGTELELQLRDLPAPTRLPGRRPLGAARPSRDPQLRTYLAVIALLWVVWLVTGTGYPWPVWPMLGWGVGVVGRTALSNREHRQV